MIIKSKFKSLRIALNTGRGGCLISGNNSAVSYARLVGTLYKKPDLFHAIKHGTQARRLGNNLTEIAVSPELDSKLIDISQTGEAAPLFHMKGPSADNFAVAVLAGTSEDTDFRLAYQRTGYSTRDPWMVRIGNLPDLGIPSSSQIKRHQIYADLNRHLGLHRMLGSASFHFSIEGSLETSFLPTLEALLGPLDQLLDCKFRPDTMPTFTAGMCEFVAFSKREDYVWGVDGTKKERPLAQPLQGSDLQEFLRECFMGDVEIKTHIKEEIKERKLELTLDLIPNGKTTRRRRNHEVGIFPSTFHFLELSDRLEENFPRILDQSEAT